MKERILEAFAELGFVPEQFGDSTYGFDFEGKHMMLIAGNDDEEFMSISIPRIYGMEDGNPLVFLKLIQKVNSNLKYIKAYEMDNDIWLFYEREIGGDDDLTVIMPKMISHLDAAFVYSRNEIKVIEAELALDEEGEEAEDAEGLAGIEDVEFEDEINDENEE